MIEMEANLVAVARIKQYSDIDIEVRTVLFTKTNCLFHA